MCDECICIKHSEQHFSLIYSSYFNSLTGPKKYRFNTCFTFLGQTFRHTLYPSYKSNRPPTPDTIVQGLQYLKASIKAMSIKVIEVRWLGWIMGFNGYWLK